ncbi:MAG: immune inhibitor A [Muribaculaceae bacterium]|nr:immune inhibitor A [Muribaculaceae bacterium]
MKNQFLLLAMALATVGASAQQANMKVERMQASQPVAVTSQQSQIRQVAKGVVAHSVNTPAGVVNKISLDMRVKSPESKLNVRLPLSGASKVAPKASAEASLYEGFEGADLSDAKWVPQGWSRIDVCTVQNTSNWHADDGKGTFGTKPYAGNYQMSINNPMDFTGNQPKEWLVSPVFTCKEGHNLSFQLKSCPAWLFDPTYMDFENWVFTQLDPVGDVVVYVREEGAEEWTKAWSQVDATLAMQTMDLTELYDNMDGKYFQYDVDMSAYAGKKVQIAFYYDCPVMGDNICLDEVAVDAQACPVSYEMPEGAYFWSYSNLFQAIATYKIKQYPVFEPLTWKSKYPDNVSFAYWEFRSPESQNDFSMDKDLTITYHSDYSSEFNTVCNIYNNATLNASAPGYSDGSYQDPECDIINVGGLPSWISNGEHLTFTSSMVPFSAGSQEIKDTDGHPLFGYATQNNADEFWTSTLLADAQPGDKLYVDKLMAIYDAPARSAVIDSVCVFAVAKVAPEAELHAMVCSVDAQGNVNLENPLGQGVCKGADAYKLYADKDVSESTFTIAMDKPVVVDGQYVIIVDGFRGPGFEYFNPMMSVEPRDDRAAMLMKIESAAVSGYVVRFSSVLATSLGQLKSSFYINPFMTYTYLVETGSDAAKVKAMEDAVVVNDEPVVLSYDSFYPAEKYTVTAPEWCEAQVEGRYDQFKLTLVAVEGAPEDVEGEVVIECPGEKKVVRVKTVKMSGITDVTATKAVKAVKVVENGQVYIINAGKKYNMQGVEVK